LCPLPEFLQHLADLHHGQVLEDGATQLLDRGRLLFAAIVDLRNVPAHVGLEWLRYAAGWRFADHLRNLNRRFFLGHVAEVAAFHPACFVDRLARRDDREIHPALEFGENLFDLLPARSDDVTDVSLVPQLPDRDLAFVHLADGSLVDALLDNAVDQDVAENVVPRRLEAVPRLGLLIQTAAYRFDRQQLDVYELVEDLVEFGRVDLKALVALKHALHTGFELHVRDIDRLAVNERSNRGRIGRGGRRRARGFPTAAGRESGRRQSRHHTQQAIPDAHVLAPRGCLRLYSGSR